MTAARVARAVLVALILGLTTATGPAPGGAPAGAQEPDSVSFAGVSQTPWVGRDGTWALELAVGGAPADGEVRAQILDRLDDRAAYNEALFGVYNEARKASIPALDVADLPVDATGARTARLAVTLRDSSPSRPGWAFLSAGLRPGVYPVEVEVRDGDGATVAETLVFLTRVPVDGEDGADRPPLQVATVLPLAGPPTIAPDGEVALPEGLAARVQATSDGLNLSPGLAATLAPRPETIEALAREPEGADALAALQQAAQGRQVIDGTYVSLPLDEMVATGLTDELTRQRERGNTILTRQLGPPDSSTLLASLGLTPATVEQLWGVGVRTVVLPPGASDGAQAPTAPFTVAAGGGRTLQAVEADAGLQVALDRRLDPVLDDAGLAAELALISAASDQAQGVVLLPDEDWPPTAEAVTRLAAVLGDDLAPVRTVDVASLVRDVPSVGPRTLRPTAPIDLGDHPTQLVEARSRLSSFASLTGPGNDEVALLDQRLLLSDERSLSLDERQAYVTSVTRVLDRRLAAVEAPPRQTITLTSSDGDLPLTLRNQLADPVEVLIELDSDSRLELRGDSALRTTLQPGTNTIDIPVHARVPGQSRVDIAIRTPDGAVVLDEVRYSVRSTAISGLGLVLSVGAALFLLLWWARHWAQSRRARAAAATPGETAT